MQVRIIELLNLTSPTVLFLFSLLFLIFCFIFLTFISFLFTFSCHIFYQTLLFSVLFDSSSFPSCLLFLWSSPPLSLFLFLNLSPLLLDCLLTLQLCTFSFVFHHGAFISYPAPLSNTPDLIQSKNHHSESWHYSPKYKELIKKITVWHNCTIWCANGSPVMVFPLPWSEVTHYTLTFSILSYTVCPCLNTNFNFSF